MAYIPKVWEDDPSTETPLDEDNMNHIEQGIYHAGDSIELDLNVSTGYLNATLKDSAGTTKNTSSVDLGDYATDDEITNLQSQIDAITVSSDVIDVVGTYSDLQNYDTSSVTEDDIIKVLDDSTHNNALSYYRWVITNNVGAWSYVGSEGPYYTKSEIDTTLQPYVKNTDYATNSTGGVIKANGYYGADVYNGTLLGTIKNYATYGSNPDSTIISKGTLENVITGKDLTTKSYVDGLVGDINTALDTINGEVI